MQPAPAPITLPEGLSAQQIGAEIARLRAQFGLTQQAVSERLHIRTRYVAAIEEGQFDQLPGKVYARGYVQTYAEFLGLDAAQVVDRCFASEGAVSSVTVHRPPPNLRAGPKLEMRGYRGIGIAAMVVLVVVLGISQWLGRALREEPQTTDTAALDPEEMLASVRTMVMPTPHNKECLVTDQWLACARADAGTALLSTLDRQTFLVLGDIDVSSEVISIPIEEDTDEPREYDTPPHDDPNEIQDRA